MIKAIITIGLTLVIGYSFHLMFMLIHSMTYVVMRVVF
jgi:hypothetical protein